MERSQRLVIGRDVRPGQKIQLAVFGSNGPLSNPPTNFIWMRYAKLDFFRGGAGAVAITPREVNVDIVRRDPAMDAIKIDQQGNLHVSGPGGLWVLSPEGKHLGTILAPKHPHNFAWGDEDGKTLYLCARSGLYRMRLNVPGLRP
jgi:gluconolactonase